MFGLNGRIDPVLADAQRTLAEARLTAITARAEMKKIRDLLGLALAFTIAGYVMSAATLWAVKEMRRNG